MYYNLYNFDRFYKNFRNCTFGTKNVESEYGTTEITDIRLKISYKPIS